MLLPNQYLTDLLTLACNHLPPAGGVTETHQYSVTEYTQPLQPNYAPAVDVHYDLSPIVMTINERPPSLLHFIVRLCAVIGGAFAITREHGDRQWGLPAKRRRRRGRGGACHGRAPRARDSAETFTAVPHAGPVYPASLKGFRADAS